MILWLCNENARYLEAEYRLQIARNELDRARLELKNITEDLARSESTMASIEAALGYIHKYADVVSLGEYIKIKDQKKSEIDTILPRRRAIPSCQTHIRKLEAEIRRMEIDLPFLKTKILEFKRSVE